MAQPNPEMEGLFNGLLHLFHSLPPLSVCLAASSQRHTHTHTPEILSEKMIRSSTEWLMSGFYAT